MKAEIKIARLLRKIDIMKAEIKTLQYSLMREDHEDTEARTKPTEPSSDETLYPDVHRGSYYGSQQRS